MPLPFPGMDPYLEGYLWPDVHSALALVVQKTFMRLKLRTQ
ncbi:MAG: DUF4058 family protein [Moorea sp. SIO3C2]|nr:DUF4058 family protein [Moorena sp. SIO3C2]